MASYNTPADVRRVLNLDAGNLSLTDAEIQTYLDEAQQDLFITIKRELEYQKFVVDTDNKGKIKNYFYFSLTPVVSIHKVLVNNSIINSTDYSLDVDTNVLTISSTLEVGDVVEVFYLPLVYHLAELNLAAYNILMRTQLVETGGQENPVLLEFEKKKDKFFNIIKSRLVASNWF